MKWTALGLLATLLPAAAFGQDSQQRAQAPGEGVWRNYDFVPGRRVLKVVDVEGERVGRFPAGQLTHVRGNMQVVTFEGASRLETVGNGVVRLTLPEETGNSFSVEFLVRIPTPNIGVTLLFAPSEGALSRSPYDYVRITNRPGIYRQANEVSATILQSIVGQLVPVRVQFHRGLALVYVGAERVAQVPDARFPSSRILEFQLDGNPRFPTYIDDIVIAKEIDDLAETLAAGGTVTTRGILFDTDRSALRPESSRTLADLVDLLTRTASLRVAIVGHTDDQGDATHNLRLSEDRARAVVEFLVAQGIDRSRLRAEGRGEEEPVATNATAEGRQENRRVVIRSLSSTTP